MFPNLDHFERYEVALAKTRVPAVEVDDQFGTITVDVKKPLHRSRISLRTAACAI
jgi:hypothetical protein